ncbi:hypothetical protein SETIT_2G216400v2 [Setaria italica]|uniref:Uncharacterized protein n=2 Tax=Setaria italica TaxID=4555 RepID=A0A368Q1L7_SETIT|nr:uncharacterized protein LOC101782623 isoform X1 [Setaria italica]RCV11809.1 hypothetical protein SETIT_2G216400v2 [Setaria italica]
MLPLIDGVRTSTRADYIIAPAPACQTLSIIPCSIASISQALSRSRKPTLCCEAAKDLRACVMGDDGATKAATGMKQIARLRELLHKWQTMALGANKQQREDEVPDVDEEMVASAIPPFVLRRLRRADTADSVLSDDESCHSPEPPPDVPRGYCPVYVGPEQRRFVIPTTYLAHPVFRLLLEKAEEEFGFRHEGALAIPCETEAFKYILQCVERHDKGLAADEASHPGMALEQEPAMHHA